MTLKKHIKRGMRSQAQQKNSKAGKGIRSKKHVDIAKREKKYGRVKPDASVTRTSVYEDHPSNKVGGMGRSQYRKMEC